VAAKSVIKIITSHSLVARFSGGDSDFFVSNFNFDFHSVSERAVVKKGDSLGVQSIDLDHFWLEALGTKSHKNNEPRTTMATIMSKCRVKATKTEMAISK